MAKPQRLKKRNQGRTSGQELIEKEKEFSEHFSKDHIDNPPVYFSESAKSIIYLLLKN